MDVFNSNGEDYENAWDLPPAAETVVAVPQAVEEEDGMFVQTFEYFKMYNVSLVFLFMCWFVSSWH